MHWGHKQQWMFPGNLNIIIVLIEAILSIELTTYKPEQEQNK